MHASPHYANSFLKFKKSKSLFVQPFQPLVQWCNLPVDSLQFFNYSSVQYFSIIHNELAKASNSKTWWKVSYICVPVSCQVHSLTLVPFVTWLTIILLVTCKKCSCHTQVTIMKVGEMGLCGLIFSKQIFLNDNNIPPALTLILYKNSLFSVGTTVVFSTVNLDNSLIQKHWLKVWGKLVPNCVFFSSPELHSMGQRQAVNTHTGGKCVLQYLS